jgi:hypothetical protein
MSYTVTLNHVRYGKYKFDLAELKRRLETRIATGPDAAKLGHLLVHTNRLMAMIDALVAGRHARDLYSRVRLSAARLRARAGGHGRGTRQAPPAAQTARSPGAEAEVAGLRALARQNGALAP